MYEIGTYIVQQSSDPTYALVIGHLKNGGEKVISINSRGVATITSTKNWYPSPKTIDEKDVPVNYLKKIVKKNKNSSISSSLRRLSAKIRINQ